MGEVWVDPLPGPDILDSMTETEKPMPLFLDLRWSDDPERHVPGFPWLPPYWLLEVTLVGHGYWQTDHEDLATLIDQLADETAQWIATGTILAEHGDGVLVPTPLAVREGHHLRDFAFQWYLHGNLTLFPSITAAVAAYRVTLPSTLSRWRAQRSSSGQVPPSTRAIRQSAN